MTIIFNQIAEFKSRVFRNIQGINLGFDEFDDLTEDSKAKSYAHRAVHASETNFPRAAVQYLRIPVETNSNSDLQANSDSGNIRTPIPVYANATIGSRRHYLLSNAGL